MQFERRLELEDWLKVTFGKEAVQPATIGHLTGIEVDITPKGIAHGDKDKAAELITGIVQQALERKLDARKSEIVTPMPRDGGYRIFISDALVMAVNASSLNLPHREKAELLFQKVPDPRARIVGDARPLSPTPEYKTQRKLEVLKLATGVEWEAVGNEAILATRNQAATQEIADELTALLKKTLHIPEDNVLANNKLDELQGKPAILAAALNGSKLGWLREVDLKESFQAAIPHDKGRNR